MKLRLLSLVIASLALAAAPNLRADGSLVPGVSQVKEIVLHGQGLILKIFQNGSGDLLYGSSGTDAQMPLRTFSFEHVYQTLTPSSGNTDRAVRGVGMQTSGNYYGENYHFYVDDQAIIDKLLTQAGVKVVYQK